jgi:hypothetical protein
MLHQGEHITGLLRVRARTSGRWQLAAARYTAVPAATS